MNRILAWTRCLWSYGECQALASGRVWFAGQLEWVKCDRQGGGVVGVNSPLRALRNQEAYQTVAIFFVFMFVWDEGVERGPLVKWPGRHLSVAKQNHEKPHWDGCNALHMAARGSFSGVERPWSVSVWGIARAEYTTERRANSKSHRTDV